MFRFNDPRKTSITDLVDLLHFPDENLREEMVSTAHQEIEQHYQELLQTMRKNKYIINNSFWNGYRPIEHWHRLRGFLKPYEVLKVASPKTVPEWAAVVHDAIIGEATYLVTHYDLYTGLREGKRLLHGDMTYKVAELFNISKNVASDYNWGALPSDLAMFLHFISVDTPGLEDLSDDFYSQVDHYIASFDNAIPIYDFTSVPSETQMPAKEVLINVGGVDFLDFTNMGLVYSNPELGALLDETESSDAYRSLKDEAGQVHSDLMLDSEIQDAEAILIFGAGRATIESMMVSSQLDFNRFGDDKEYYFFDSSRENLERAWVTALKYGITNANFIQIDFNNLSQTQEIDELKERLSGKKKFGLEVHVLENYITKEKRDKILGNISYLFEEGDELLFTDFGVQTPNEVLLDAYFQNYATMAAYANELGRNQRTEFSSNDFDFEIGVAEDQHNKYIVMYGIAQRDLEFADKRMFDDTIYVEEGDKVLFFASVRDGENYIPIPTSEHHACSRYIINEDQLVLNNEVTQFVQ